LILRAVLLVTAAALVVPPYHALAQAQAGAPPLAVGLAGGSATVTVGQVLHESALEDALRSGLPLRIRIQVELWRDRLFDELVEQTAWTQVLVFEPIDGHFLIGRAGDDVPDRYPSYAAARGAIETLYRPQLRPRAPGRYYYLAAIEIETLSLSDLEELGQWLRGEAAPATRGRRSVGAAVGTGLRRLLIRVLDLPARRYQARSDHFVFP
jgi:hypothetical protein